MFTRNIKQSFLVAGVLLVFWTPVQAWLLNSVLHVEWTEALIDGGLTASYLGIVSFFTFSFLSYYHPKKGQLIYVAGGVLLAGYLMVIGVEDAIQTLSPGQLEYLSAFTNYRILFSELISLIILSLAFNIVGGKSNDVEEKRRVDTEKMARDAELASLRQQLQPHFLFNSLNSINALIGTQPEKARKMVQQLSDFLRGTIKKDDSQLVSLFDEMSQLKLYLEIEKVRFGHRLAATIDNESGSLETKLPPLLIQPVVENAIKFGLYDTIGETVISIKTKVEQNHLVVEVENPFDPATSTPRHGTGFGLSSLQRRLYLLYARNDLLTTSQNENIFITQIKIPQTS
jgi:sensor histidine kinase YesM